MQTFDLSNHHTFGFEQIARSIVTVASAEQLKQLIVSRQLHNPIILGEGSNAIFLEDYDGDVLINRIMGRKLEDNADGVRLTLGAGENWDSAVAWLSQQGIGGLENLGLIPGCVGAAPVQNIGAYGVELSQVLESLTFIDPNSGETHSLSKAECQLGYRDSVFKHQLKDKAWITELVLWLPKPWQPKLSYGPLKSLEDESDLSPLQVYREVCQIRQQKLPDPKVLGNAGSFFKNPVVSVELYDHLRSLDSNLVGYPQHQGGIKLAAGYLIDKLGLKGHLQGKVGVHQHQALVLVNHGGGKPQDLVALANHIQQRVFEVYQVKLQPEVRIFGSNGEVEISRYG
ncbi:UDP-N-acetylmuramate dehydrogenase [Paraferrimonas sedimenticola]|uniref:UDP-N-acetylenolpyruvoylglucosamine reductase n=1 Tax=Paraferrimonas sedimenticola TaxID=375674 RepID=A0AA37RYM0_9GAMM|nr:UDP-N-acetylmuramate dehydrogenase [Paraferrimonas sedimenticola]GLP97761.1 UDP-N-acetylenolpyruvoylglucosamine reductase [Paraferrimonas sedimenticola]